MLPVITFRYDLVNNFKQIGEITLGEHIKKKRTEKAFTQKQLAKKLSVSEATIVHWEREQTAKIPATVYPKIIKFLNYCPVEKVKNEGQKLSLFRKHAGLSQRKLAEKLFCDQRYVASWENGQYLIPYEKKKQLYEIFNYEFKTAKPTYKDKIPKELQTIGDHLKSKRLKQRLSVKNILNYFSISSSSAYRDWEDKKDIQISVKYYPEITAFLGYCPVEKYTTMGEKLKLYRKYAGLSQRDLAKKLNCKDTTIAKWEKGQTRIPPKQMKKLRNVFGESF